MTCDHNLKVAICICTCGRPDLLERLLVSLRQIELGVLSPKEILIIVVDNDPDGRARSIFGCISASLPFELLLVEEVRRGRAFARNKAVSEAITRHAQFVAFIDDDDLPASDWLQRLWKTQNESQADIVFGTGQTVIGADCPDWLKDSVFLQSTGSEGVTKFSIPKGISTFNVLIRCTVFERLNMAGFFFLPEFKIFEDTDFFIRASRIHATFKHSQDSVIYRYFEPHRLTPPGLLNEAFFNGVYTMRLLQKHGSAVQTRKRRFKAFKKLFLFFFKIPICFFSKTSLMNNLYLFCREFGVLISNNKTQIEKTSH
jgi:glycosyltransferase involved in cell wall biosynthesis